MTTAVIAVLMMLSPVSGQTPAAPGALSGNVRDPSDAPVPGARVVLKQGDREVAVAITSSSGGFRFDDVSMGSFDLFVTVAGFEPVRRTVRAGSPAGRPIVIKLGSCNTKGGSHSLRGRLAHLDRSWGQRRCSFR